MGSNFVTVSESRCPTLVTDAITQYELINKHVLISGTHLLYKVNIIHIGISPQQYQHLFLLLQFLQLASSLYFVHGGHLAGSLGVRHIVQLEN